jgi:hypothetical protein
MSRLITMFCDIDDFCKWFEPLYTQRMLRVSEEVTAADTCYGCWPDGSRLDVA